MAIAAGLAIAAAVVRQQACCLQVEPPLAASPQPEAQQQEQPLAARRCRWHWQLQHCLQAGQPVWLGSLG
jgi:hypothetical protein